MIRLETMKVILRNAEGGETVFSEPLKGTDCCASWRFSDAYGVSACYVSGFCGARLDGDAALLLRPTVTDKNVEFLAIQNHSAYWCRPLFGDDLSAMPPRKPIQGLLLREGSLWKYYLPVCADTYKTAIRSYEDGFEFYTYSNCQGLVACEDQLAFVSGEGEDPFELLHRCAYAAARLLDNGLRMREERKLPEVFEYLGWCSWDSMQIRVSHEGLLTKAKEFADKGVPVHFAIIDDMWADCPHLAEIPEDSSFVDMVHEMHRSKMRSFNGDPKRFPKGMAAAIADLKAAGIPEVGIWFPTTGYWSGLDADGEASEWMDYLTVSNGESLSCTDPGKLVVIPETEKAFALFDIFCRRVRSWGGDFVKIDNQGFLAKNYRNLRPIGQAARAIQTALDSTTGSNFNGAMINCMGMPSECMFNRRSSAVCRCSDDFAPENREWFAKNVLQCAYNGLQQGQYYVNDWDMWWTDDEQATKNSVCRAISGGPIYVSDKIGRTRPEILKPLCYQDGRLLRPDLSGKPTADCLLGDPVTSGKPLKLFNRVGEAAVVAAFNIDAESRPLSGTVSAKDGGLEGFCACYEYFSGTCRVLKAGEAMEFTLSDNDDFRLYTLVPLSCDSVTVLGRTDKFIGVKALLSRAMDTATFYEGGPIAFLCEDDVRVFSEYRELPVSRDGALCRVDAAPEETVLRFVR